MKVVILGTVTSKKQTLLSDMSWFNFYIVPNIDVIATKLALSGKRQSFWDNISVFQGTSSPYIGVGVFPYSTKVILIISKKALPTVFMNKAHNSKSKSHGLVFVITPVSKENGTYYWRKQCSYNVYYCLYFHSWMIFISSASN